MFCTSKIALENFNESKKNNKKAIHSQGLLKNGFCVGNAESYVTIINKTDTKIIPTRLDELSGLSIRY